MKSVEIMWKELVKEDLFIRRGMFATLGLAAAIAVSVRLIEGRVPPEIPLLYSRPWGEGQLAGRQTLWWLAGGLGGVGIFSLILGAAMTVTQKTAGRIIIWAAVLIEALGLLALWNVWWRVGI